MFCDRCKVNDATVHVTGAGHFCRDCHNRQVADEYGYELVENYVREIMVKDADGRLHHFEISHLLMPEYSEWDAVEVGDGYEFSVMVRPTESQVAAMLSLHRKIVAGLQFRSLERQSDRVYLSNALHTAEGQYLLKATGWGRIVANRDTQSHDLMIDGRRISGADFMDLLTMYEGWNLNFQISEPSDDILEKGMVLVPLQIEGKAMLERFEETLRWFLENDFLNFKQEYGLSAALHERITEYEAICRRGDRETAKRVGRAMIRRLKAIDSSSDTFPEFHVARIQKALPGFAIEDDEEIGQEPNH